MKKHLKIACFFTIGIMPSLLQAETQLLVTHSTTVPPATLTYSDSIRIEQAVFDAIKQLQSNAKTGSNLGAVYWLGAGLLDMNNTAELAATQQSILAQLAAMSAEDSAQKQAIDTLTTFIRQASTALRVMQPLDPDLIRIHRPYNALINGRYTLVIPPRATEVTVLGAVTHAGRQSWLHSKNSQDYLTQSQPIDNADKSFVWIIQPDGNAIKQPIGYWNARPQDIAPGAILYVPFAAMLTDYSALNSNIVELLRNQSL